MLQNIATVANLSNSNPPVAAPAENVSDLVRRWHAVELELLNLWNNKLPEEAAAANDEASVVPTWEKQSGLEREQLDVVAKLAITPARSLAEVMSKLEVWKTTVMPDEEDEAFLQPTDKIILSLLQDLNAFTA